MQRTKVSPVGMGMIIGSVCAISIGSLIAATGTSDSTIRSQNGHDIAGTSANRPANMTVGEIWFNTTTRRLEVANGASVNNVTEVADSTGTGAAGLANGLLAGSGAAGTTTTAGGAGGAATFAAGTGGAKTGTGPAAGGAGGATSISAGAGGATASSGSNAGGAGGTITLTSGNGGAAGSIDLVLGTGGTSAGGTDGANGLLLVNGAAGLEPVNFIYAAPDDQAFFVAGRNYRLIGITFRPLVVGSDMSAVTATIKKAGSGTSVASGTALHTGTADLKGTVNTNQSLTLSSTSSNLDIASGDAIGIDVTGTTTAARGVVTLLLNPR